MADGIKSNFIFKKIFSFIFERKKLNLVKYNKGFQNKLNISLLNYKVLSGKYIICEPNGIGKIYDSYNDFLIFEGEFLNGKKNGKGVEYDERGEIIFEGEYLNGERNGKGKEYYNGNIVFEGEYLNGEQVIEENKEHNKYNEFKKGFVSEYEPNGQLLFEGEYLNGERNGKGKEYNYNGQLLFEGEYLNGERNGKGKEYNYSGQLLFEGEYLNGGILNGKCKNIIIKVN